MSDDAPPKRHRWALGPTRKPADWASGSSTSARSTARRGSTIVAEPDEKLASSSGAVGAPWNGIGVSRCHCVSRVKTPRPFSPLGALASYRQWSMRRVLTVPPRSKRDPSPFAPK